MDPVRLHHDPGPSAPVKPVSPFLRGDTEGHQTANRCVHAETWEHGNIPQPLPCLFHLKIVSHLNDVISLAWDHVRPW